MALKDKTKEKINKIAAAEARKQIEHAADYYIEKSSFSSSSEAKRAKRKLKKFRKSDDLLSAARDYLAEFLLDYVNKLMESGKPEEEALEQAVGSLDSDNEYKLRDLRQEYIDYYSKNDPEGEDPASLYYAAFILFGLVVGSFAGILIGINFFEEHFWQTYVISAGVGMIAGLAGGIMRHIFRK